MEAAFLTITAHPIHTCDIFYVERYAHGGMSSGRVDPDFWRQIGIPFLLSRFSTHHGIPADRLTDDR